MVAKYFLRNGALVAPGHGSLHKSGGLAHLGLIQSQF